MISNVYRYHDTFPHPEGVPFWPNLVPPTTAEGIPLGREMGMIIGDPDHAIEQIQRWESAGVDQLIFGTGAGSHEDLLETIRLMGQYVIPKFHTDPVHRTTRMRAAAFS
jgi:alkanesulfonate monooxygenase SsuD/methylene tetrahydromethanopterin reductase-like flavin-dependent oxidoreductase (luciferase family)